MSQDIPCSVPNRILRKRTPWLLPQQHLLYSSQYYAQMCEIKTHFIVLYIYGYFWYYYFQRLFGVKKVKESAQVKQRNINLFLKAPCVRFFHLELMYCLQDHPEIMPCCSKNAAKSLLIHCQKLPAALSATFFIYCSWKFEIGC